MPALREHRVFGPPGTGKTTRLTGDVSAGAKEYGPESVIVASFTRGAASELTSRVRNFPRNSIATLHSHGRRAIGSPKTIEKDDIKDWNQRYEAWKLPTDLFDRDGESRYEAAFSDEDSPEKVHGQYDLLRNKLVPVDQRPENVQIFGERWEAWKRERGVVDFTDMIELALAQSEAAPGRPQIGFFDEVQDFTPLELALVRKWGAQMEQIVLAGDDDQMIYGFKGASVDAFLDEGIEPASVTVLDQSYRVPVAVQRAATQWIAGVRRRQSKPYRSRAEEGVASALWDMTIEDSDGLIRLIEDRSARTPDWTVMVIVDAARMLASLLQGLREAGIPYHNPYSEKRGDWSPLRPRRGVSSAARLVALSRYDETVWGDAARRWTPDEVAQWADPLRADSVFLRGSKKRASMLLDGYSLDDLAACFTDGDRPGGALDHLGRFDLDWYSQNLTGAYVNKMRFPIAIARKRGVVALTETPRVIVGTIHSVKGGEADTVILCPDLSYFRQQDLDAGGDLADDVRRLFYVGMTRARHELLVTAPSSRRSLHPHDLLGIA